MVLYENYVAGDDAYGVIYNANWNGQTFYSLLRHTVTEVKLKLYRKGTVGTITVAIRATSSGLPTGADLTTGTYDGDTIGTDSGGYWITIPVTEYELPSPGDTYAVIWRLAAGVGDAADNYIRAITDASSPIYQRGSYVASTNSGTSWAATTGTDFLFEINGNAAANDYTFDDIDYTDEDYDTRTFDDDVLNLSSLTADSEQLKLCEMLWLRTRSNIRGSTAALPATGKFDDSQTTALNPHSLKEYKVVGVTVDAGDVAIPGCTVYLLSGNFNSYRVIQKMTSDASGNYLFYVDDPNDVYTVISFKSDGLGGYIKGITDRDLTAVPT